MICRMADDITVFRASPARRWVAGVGMAALVVLTLPVVLTYGWLATIGVVLVVLIIGQLYWQVLRPRLTADEDGVEIVAGRRPERIAWTDIQRTEVSPKGTLLVAKGGHEVLSRYPYGLRSTSSTQAQTDADRAAIFLAARTAWAKRKDGPPPVYTPAEKPKKA
jgi:hypothetical protein